MTPRQLPAHSPPHRNAQPQPTFQDTFPQPPYNDNIWHRSPTRRHAPDAQDFTLASCLSLPIAYNSHLAGCPGAPVRDSHHIRMSSVLRDRASSVHLSRPLSADSLRTAHERLDTLNTLASRNIPCIVHLLTGLAPG